MSKSKKQPPCPPLLRGKQRDPIPESFASIEEAAEFWDNHSTDDYVRLRLSSLASLNYLTLCAMSISMWTFSNEPSLCLLRVV